MSLQSQQFDRLVHADPALSHFPIQLTEDVEGGRWQLHGFVPTQGIKKRAGSLARGVAPPQVWLVNEIVIQPDDGVGPAEEKVVA